MEFLSDVSSGDDRYRPSFFELAAQEQLRDLLQPVVRYLLSVLAQRFPRYFLRFSNRHEETYAAMMLLVERHYLKNWSGSFAENFYGMKRRRRPGVSSERAQAAVDLFTNHEALRRRDVRWSLVFLVGIPYLRSKADDLYETLGGGAETELFDDRPSGNTELVERRSRAQRLRDTLERLFKRFWPFLNTGYEVLLLAYNVAYLFDKTPYYRPWLHWLGIDLRRMSEQDYRKMNAAQESIRRSPFQKDPTTGLSPTIRQILGRSLLLGPQYALEALKVLLPTSIFFFKFLEWWYSSSYARSRMTATSGNASDATPAIKAPRQKLTPHPDGVLGGGVAPKPGVCPVCKKGVTNPAALSTGWVGDYRCFYDYVEKEGKCPVTQIKTTVGDLRKIMG